MCDVVVAECNRGSSVVQKEHGGGGGDEVDTRELAVQRELVARSESSDATCRREAAGASGVSVGETLAVGNGACLKSSSGVMVLAGKKGVHASGVGDGAKYGERRAARKTGVDGVSFLRALANPLRWWQLLLLRGGVELFGSWVFWIFLCAWFVNSWARRARRCGRGQEKPRGTGDAEARTSGTETLAERMTAGKTESTKADEAEVAAHDAKMAAVEAEGMGRGT
ncbi:hypothetical protein F5148DRAFT_1150653 [Russula earlei]|uniref:Uncharacterized protein n=1 Tax=Russula earlei TaxID=71964 RepID=A0ACC0U4P8_9AGAM|nr:hypothetical protein F5148DRAFT_1150653 [Russula earlei]